MNGTVQTGFQKYSCPSAFVLDNYKPEDVARAAIENGRQKQPFYIFNMDEAYSRIQHFRALMPRVQIFYAMKSNDTDMMLKLAVALGIGFDCASPGEIYKVRQLNVNPKSIIYAMTTKSPEQMLYARESGVQHTKFDTSYELTKIKKYWPDAKLLIRLRVDSVSKIQLGDKFGCDFETEAVELLDEAASLGLTVVGVAFHVGCVCSSLESYAVGIRQAKTLFDHEAKAGRKMHIVDIGGGYASDRTDRIDQVSKIINQSLDEFFPDPNVQVIAEPGRYVSDSAFSLYCNVSNVRRIKKNGKQVSMVYLNDGVYGTMRYPENWHVVSKFMKENETDTGILEDTILWGPSCDSHDQVRKNFSVHLPRFTPQDWLVFEIHGAYTFTFSTRFSSLEIPLIRPVVSLELWNKIHKCSSFKPYDFITNPDISAPLPMTLPPPPPKNDVSKHSHIPTLTV